MKFSFLERPPTRSYRDTELNSLRFMERIWNCLKKLEYPPNLIRPMGERREDNVPYLRSEQLIPGTLLNIREFGLCVVVERCVKRDMNWVEVLLLNGDVEWLNPNCVLEEELMSGVKNESR